MFYAGLDLGGKKSRLHVRNAKGETVYAGWTRSMEELKKAVEPWGSDLSVAMEATTGAFFVHDQLLGRVGEIKVAHPRDLRAIAHARIKNDRLDADKLSELNRGDLIPTVWVPPPEVRDARELIVEHARLRRTIRVDKVRIRALLRRWGLGQAVEKPFTRAGLSALKELNLPPGAKYVLEQKIERLREWRKAELRMKGEVERQIPLGKREQWLMSIPGVGPCTARWMANVLGDVKRFPDGRHLASYLGLVPSERTSCTEPRRGGITKSGNVWLRWLMVQCAWRAVRATKKDVNGEWREMYSKMVIRGKSKKRAIVAVANRLTRVAYAVLRDERMYESRKPREEEKTKKIYLLKTIRPAAP